MNKKLAIKYLILFSTFSPRLFHTRQTKRVTNEQTNEQKTKQKKAQKQDFDF